MLPLLIFSPCGLQKSFVQAHSKRLKNGNVIQIAAYYDKRIKKAATHAPDHTHDVSHLSDADKAQFSNMHKEQHVAHFYESHALKRKLSTEEQLRDTLKRSLARYEANGDKKSAAITRKKIAALSLRIGTHKNMHEKATRIVESIGRLKDQLVEGSGELKDDTDKAHAHYVGKLGERFKGNKAVIEISSAEIGADIQDRKACKEKVLGIIRPTYQDNPKKVTTHDGDKIIIAWNGVKHAMNAELPTWQESAAALHIGELIANSSAIQILPDKLGRNDPKSTTIYQAKAKFDGIPHQVSLFVRNHSDGNRYYDHVTIEGKSPAGLTGSETPTLPFTGDNQGNNNASDKSIAPSEKNTSTGDLNPNDPNYRYRDTGNVAGSRKEQAANRIKMAGKTGERLNATDIDWQEIEQNPREAQTLITKANLFGAVDWNAIKANGMEPGAGFLIDKVYRSIAKEAGNSEQDRKDYALGLQTIRDRMEQCKTPDNVMRTLSEISDELTGKMQSESNENANNPLSDVWASLGEKFVGLIKRGYRYGGLNYDQFNPAIYKSGSKPFLKHAIDAKQGAIKDWSWAEKDQRADTGEGKKREKPFQLLVSDKIIRTGGKVVQIESTQAFKDMVGLRDVQSGNWVLKDKDSAMFHVQKAAEAFTDLGDILGVDTNKIALNGRLAMAFGARGHGHALAHYEPVQRIINLTKMKGGGSLAHEWLHSLDNVIAEMETGKAGSTNDWVSENPNLLPEGRLKTSVIGLRNAMLQGNTPKKEAVHYSAKNLATARHNLDNPGHKLSKNIKEAGSLDKAIAVINSTYAGITTPKALLNAEKWRKITAAYYDNNPDGGVVAVATGGFHSSFAAGALNLDKGVVGKYWSQPKEMMARAFEAYVTDTLKRQGRENTYLSSHADNADYRVMGDYSPYPQGDERTRINAAFDSFIDALRESGTLHKAFGIPSNARILFFARPPAAKKPDVKAILNSDAKILFFKSFIPAHTRRLKNGKVIQVAAYSNKRLRRDAAAVQVDHDDIKAEDKAHWARLHQEQHVLHHTDKALHELRIKEANKAIAHHHAKAAHHEAQRDIARKNGDTAALSEHNKALAHHHNQAQKWTNSRAGHERHLAKVDHKLEGIRALKEQLWKGSGEVGETSDFGPVYRQFKHDAKGAIEHLKLMKTGEAVAALHHPEVGDIDLVWGKEGAAKSDGLGLAKLVKYHPEVVDNLQAILLSMKKDDTRSTAKRLQLESENHQAGIRLDWDGKQKHWLLTAFEKRVGDSTRTDIMGLAGRDDTARSSTNSDKSITEPPKKASQKAIESDTEKKLRDLWTTQGVSKERQDELIAQVAGKSRQGAKVGPFTIPKKDNTSSLKPKTDGHGIDSKKQPKITPTGKENEVKTAKGTKVNTRFAVVEASDLTTSHDANGNANADYPKELQPRNRGRDTSQAQIARIAKNLDPDMLGRTRNASSGAPIVGDDGVVESGNGRTLAINQAYRSGNADDYREWLEDVADTYGLDTNQIKGMKNPVLVRVRTSDIDRAQFAREANQSDMLAMTATEKAKADTNHLTEAVIGKLSIDGDLSAASNRDFIMAFMGKLGDDESAGLSTTDGRPTKQLYDRAQAAIFSKAYNDDRLLELMADTDKPDIANIIKSLNQAAPSFITARSVSVHHAKATSGKITDAVSVSLDKQAIDAIVKATEAIKKAKDSNMPIEKLIAQGDMFGGVDPVVAQMALFIKDNNRSPARMGEAFKAMADFLVKELTYRQNENIFDDKKPVNISDVIKAANDHLQKQYGGQVKAIGSRTGGFIDIFTETRGQEADRERFLATPLTKSMPLLVFFTRKAA